MTIESKAYVSTKEVAKKFTVTLQNGSETTTIGTDYAYGAHVVVRGPGNTETTVTKRYDWVCNGVLVKKGGDNYSFIITENTDLVITEVKATKATATVALIASQRIANGSAGKSKVILTVKWTLPAGCKLISAGLKRGYGVDANTPATELSTTNTSTLKTPNGSYSLTVNMSAATSKKCISAQAYVRYIDSTGTYNTVESDSVVSVNGF